MPTAPRSRPSSDGQATPLLAVALLLAAAVVLALVTGGGRALAGARARTAADAAALAGAAEGPEAARHLAAANGATVVSLSLEGPEVVVEVEVAGVRARARARREGTWCGSEPWGGAGISYTRPPCPSSPG